MRKVPQRLVMAGLRPFERWDPDIRMSLDHAKRKSVDNHCYQLLYATSWPIAKAIPDAPMRRLANFSMKKVQSEPN